MSVFWAFICQMDNKGQVLCVLLPKMEKKGTLGQKRRPKGDPIPQKGPLGEPGPLKGTQLGTVGIEFTQGFSCNERSFATSCHRA